MDAVHAYAHSATANPGGIDPAFRAVRWPCCRSTVYRLAALHEWLCLILCTKRCNDGQDVEEGCRIRPFDDGSFGRRRGGQRRGGIRHVAVCRRSTGCSIVDANVSSLGTFLLHQLMHRIVQPAHFLAGQSGPILLVEDVQILCDVPCVTEREKGRMARVV